jgi:hypothetical protein
MNQNDDYLERKLGNDQSRNLLGGAIIIVGLFFIVGSGYYLLKR